MSSSSLSTAMRLLPSGYYRSQMRHVPGFVVAAVLVCAPAAGSQPAITPIDPEAAYQFLLARQLERQDKLPEAIAALQRALELAPRSAEVRAELAGLYARNDKPVDALNTAEEALKHDPDNREANRILGTIFAALSEQKRPLRPGDDPSQYAARALAALQKARGDGGDLNLLLMLGRLQLRAGQHEAAIGSLRRVVEEQPQFTEGAILMSAAQEGAGQLAAAAETLEAAIAINPSAFR